MIETIAEGHRRTRKKHQCFDCYRTIPAGTVARFFTGKYDGVYTLYMHPDCAAAAQEYHSIAGTDDCEGVPPLRDELCNSGQYQQEINWMRGMFPHVACRMELTDQLRAALSGGGGE